MAIANKAQNHERKEVLTSSLKSGQIKWLLLLGRACG